MGNITTDANGNVNVVLTSELIKLQDTASVVGRALVIHEKNDNGGMRRYK
jgi:Cu/Zn superoxide dismutase